MMRRHSLRLSDASVGMWRFQVKFPTQTQTRNTTVVSPHITASLDKTACPGTHTCVLQCLPQGDNNSISSVLKTFLNISLSTQIFCALLR
jgi:hypothetical protein